MKLRPYQITALDKLRASLAGGHKRVMLYSPTGSGKTVTAEAMIRGAIAKGKRVLFIANRRQLVDQASRHLKRAGIHHGILQADNTRNLDARVLVCSIDTIHARGIPENIGLIVIDEAHGVAGSLKYRELLRKLSAVPTVGLTATPFAPGLGAVFSDMVIAATIRELIDAEHLVDVDIFAPNNPDLAGVRTQRGIGGELDYNERQLAEVMDKPSLHGDIVKHQLRHAPGKSTVVFCINIPQSQHLVAEFNAAGVPAAHLDYHHSDLERADILGAFNRREITVLSNCGLLAEGWDAPHAECMILARPTKSLTRFIQMVGRVLRRAPGKKKAILLDHSGTVLRLGFPTDDLPLELDDGKANKPGKSRQEHKPSEPKPCPKCKYVRPAGVHTCPSCGFAPQRQNQVEVTDGELTRIERKTRKPLKREAGQHAYSQLLGFARNKRWKDGWAFFAYKAYASVEPGGLRKVAVTPSPSMLRWITSYLIAQREAKKKIATDGPARLAALKAQLERENRHGQA